MLSQNIDCQKCGYSNKLGTIYCRNCGTKLKFDKKLLNVHKSREQKGIFLRIIKSLLFIAVVIALGMAFCPWGFPEYSKLEDQKQIDLTLAACKSIDKLVLGSRKNGIVSSKFTAKEATFATNYLTQKHDSKSLNAKAKKKSNEKDGQESELAPTFDFIIKIKDDKTLSIIVKEKYFNFLPCRLELSVVPKLIINTKEKTKTLEYEISAARFGHLPLPLILKEQIIMIFEELVSPKRELAKQYLNQIKEVRIVKDKIYIVVSK